MRDVNSNPHNFYLQKRGYYHTHVHKPYAFLTQMYCTHTGMHDISSYTDVPIEMCSEFYVLWLGRYSKIVHLVQTAQVRSLSAT